MAIVEDEKGRGEPPMISTLTVEDLLGRPLNDVEKKNAPDILYTKGIIKIPLLGPKVSIVGSRKASSEGLRDAGKMHV